MTVQRQRGDGRGLGQGSGRAEYAKYVVVLVIPALVLIAIIFFGCGSHPLEVGRAKLIASSSTKFTPMQIKGAFAAVKNNMGRGYNGCTLDWLRYNEKKSNDILRLEEEAGKGHPAASSAYDEGIKPYGMKRVAIFFARYSCESEAAMENTGTSFGGFNCSIVFTGNAQAVSESNRWKVLDCGNG
jgi:hypothetical protein